MSLKKNFYRHFTIGVLDLKRSKDFTHESRIEQVILFWFVLQKFQKSK